MTARRGTVAGCLAPVLVAIVLVVALVYVAYCGGVYGHVLARSAVAGWELLD